jgi:uncharacterized protein YfaS (alpha-2-macroglobulin family)
MRYFKTLLFFVVIFLVNNTLMAQNNNYDKLWATYKTAIKKGLTKDALAATEKVFTLAAKEKNTDMQILAAIRQINLYNQINDTEDGIGNSIKKIDSLTNACQPVAKNILLNIKAQILANYAREHNWQIKQRTKVSNDTATDIATWSLARFDEEVTKLYIASLDKEAALQKVVLNSFKNTIDLNDVDGRTSTLFDLLANYAIAYFNTDLQFNEGQNPFLIDKEAYFAPTVDFIANSSFANQTHRNAYALLIYKKLLHFYTTTNNETSLLKTDLQRLAFVYQHCTLNNKEKLYTDALEVIEKKYAQTDAAAEAIYTRAILLATHGQTYKAGGPTTHQFAIKAAIDLLNEVIKNHPKSNAATKAHNLLINYTNKQFNISTENVNTVNDPIRALVKYKNINKVYCRIVKVDADFLTDIANLEYKNKLSKYNKLKTIYDWEQSLPNLTDYQEHSVEIKINSLPAGKYILLVSINKTFAIGNNAVSETVLDVSNISYVRDNNDNVFVLDRVTGKPMPKATIQVWQQEYNNKKEKYELIKGGSFKTNNDGFTKISLPEYRNAELQITTANDELFTSDNIYKYNTYYEQQSKDIYRAHFFTDRGIYRPGQMVHTKALWQVTRVNGAREVATGQKTTITLFDANGQVVTKVPAVTNSFGSFSHIFTLPEGLMNGQFRLQDSLSGDISYFRVEEYKRPTFTVEVEKPKLQYQLNDTVKITGTAKAYNGSKIGGAKVVYRVVRKNIYPDWWGWYYRSFYNNTPAAEITNGTAITKDDGSFDISFLAKPDKDVNANDPIIFNFDVQADVTDITGETRSNSTFVRVSTALLQLKINASGTIAANALSKLNVACTNINEVTQSQKITVTLQKLTTNTKMYRARYWQKPDLFILSAADFEKWFPNDAYNNEDEVNNWPVESIIKTIDDSTSKPFNFGTVAPGHYKLIATTTDSKGNTVKDEKIIEVEGSNHFTTKITGNKEIAEPQNPYTITTQTNYPEVWLVQKTKTMQQNIGTINVVRVAKNQPLTNTLNITEADRGGIYNTYVYVKNNRYYQIQHIVNIPWSNKELTITTNTFRDKLLPGEKEKFSFTISGNKKEAIAAEVLASMYDASLDQILPFKWQVPFSYPTIGTREFWAAETFKSQISVALAEWDYKIKTEKYFNPAQIREIEMNGYGGYRRRYDRTGAVASVQMEDVVIAGYAQTAAPAARMDKKARKEGGLDFGADKEGDLTFKNKPAPPPPADAPLQIRKNFNETAFFYPNLLTDAKGNITFEFTMPEALTEWKLQTLATTASGAQALATNKVITQKPLMITSFAPRFFREGDNLIFTAKVTNLSEKEVTGTATLELLDATTNKPVDGWFKNVFPQQYFTTGAGQNSQVSFPVEIPYGFNKPLAYRIIAKTPTHTDGEEKVAMVVTNRMLVTESLPINMRKQNNKTFSFDKLKKADDQNGTLSHHAVTVEYTSNPAWYAIQALPYMVEYPYDCMEQTFSKYYANAIAATIANKYPKIKAVFNTWKIKDTAALLSNLQKNQELKSALLEETPWVLDAQNETQQKKNIALLFDLTRIAAQKQRTIKLLTEGQLSSGAFSWFKGDYPNRYITQHIATGIGHLQKLNAIDGSDKAIEAIAVKALPYLDNEITKDYKELLRNKAKMSAMQIGNFEIQYLYMRSFYKNIPISAANKTAYDYFYGQAKKYWLQHSKYMQGMVALVLQRSGDITAAKGIVKSLEQNAIINEELGMYWKEFNTGGYYWYQAPIESHALLIEAFNEVNGNAAQINDLKTWLLKRKQTQNWGTTKATAEACYALLSTGDNWLAEEPTVKIQLGNAPIITNTENAEAGTGYIKTRFTADKVNNTMGNINVNVSNVKANNVTSWGSVYWQYFEQLDKITMAATPLKIVKELYKEAQTKNGLQLESVKEGATLKVGDKIKVRIVLKVDRVMEYVHLKDMRASCMEPTNVLSQFKWQDGLGYYEVTKDASTNFFFSNINKGTYVFEYAMFVTHEGNFSNGVTTAQCMYAPEFTSHSEGVRVTVEK